MVMEDPKPRDPSVDFFWYEIEIDIVCERERERERGEREERVRREKRKRGCAFASIRERRYACILCSFIKYSHRPDRDRHRDRDRDRNTKAHTSGVSRFGSPFLVVIFL